MRKRKVQGYWKLKRYREMHIYYFSSNVAVNEMLGKLWLPVDDYHVLQSPKPDFFFFFFGDD